MKTLFFISLLFFSLCGSSQNELVNTSVSKHSLYGGPQGSATIYTYSYVLTAKEEVEMVNIEHEGAKLILQKGDSLIICLNTPILDKADFIVNEIDSINSDNLKNDSTTIYKTMEVRGQTCVYIYSRYEFDHVSTYSFRNQKLVVKKKSGFDSETEMCGY